MCPQLGRGGCFGENELVGLSHKHDSLPSELSGGEQQRVAVCLALVNDPPIILADEPIASLDPESSRRVMEVLSKINKEDGVTVIPNPIADMPHPGYDVGEE